MVQYTYVFLAAILLIGLAFILYMVSLYRGPSTRGAVFLSVLRQKGYSFAEMLPYEAFLDQTVVGLKNGCLLGGWFYRGEDLDSSTDEELDVIVDSVNSALVPLGPGWTLHVDVMRVPVQSYPESDFPDPTTKIIDEERREFGKRDRAYFDSRYSLCLSWSPPSDSGERVKGSLFGDRSNSGSRVDPREQVKKFNTVMDSIDNLLGRRLNLSKRMNADQLLTHIYRCIVGSYKANDYQTITLPAVETMLDEYLGFCVGGVHAGIEPKVGRTHVRVIVPGIPHATYPGVVDFLNSISSSYRWNTRFILLAKEEATRELELKRKYWSQKRKGLVNLAIEALAKGGASSGHVNQDAVDMVDDVNEAIRENDSDLVRYGYLSTKLILHHENPAVLQADIDRIREFLGANGYPSRVEEENSFEAFMGSLPGDTAYDVRRFLVSTKNFCHILPTTSVWLGNPENKHLKGPPLAICRTRGSSPFRFNLHVADVGHTSVIGPTGTGKTTILNLMQSQFFRYENASVFVFDYKNGAYPLVNAAGGDYYDIATPGADPISFCPLAGIEDPSELGWAAEWIEDLIRLQVTRDLGPNDREVILKALERLAQDRMKPKTLSNLMIYLQDEDLRQAIRYYTVGNPMGGLLDSESDSLREGRFQGFEMQHLMSSGPRVVIPVLLYLFHRIDRRLKGDPTLIVLDEAWTFLGHDVFAEKIRVWLKVLRSKNASVVFATQNLSDVVNSPIKDVITDNVPSKIFLPNPSAGTDLSVPFYRAFGLSTRQIQIISMAIPKREYYYANSEREYQLFELNLGPVQLAFMGSSGSADIARMRELIAKCEKEGHRADWPAVYLESKDLFDAADRWREYGRTHAA